MSKSVNKVMLVGHIGQDPNIKYTNSGKPVGTIFLLAAFPIVPTGSWQPPFHEHLRAFLQKFPGKLG